MFDPPPVVTERHMRNANTALCTPEGARNTELSFKSCSSATGPRRVGLLAAVACGQHLINFTICRLNVEQEECSMT